MESVRGFAVVSDEVRKLSQKSEISIKKISSSLSELITAINDVASKVFKINDLYVSLKSVFDNMENISKEINSNIKIQANSGGVLCYTKIYIANELKEEIWKLKLAICITIDMMCF